MGLKESETRELLRIWERDRGSGYNIDGYSLENRGEVRTDRGFIGLYGACMPDTIYGCVSRNKHNNQINIYINTSSDTDIQRRTICRLCDGLEAVL